MIPFIICWKSLTRETPFMATPPSGPSITESAVYSTLLTICSHGAMWAREWPAQEQNIAIVTLAYKEREQRGGGAPLLEYRPICQLNPGLVHSPQCEPRPSSILTVWTQVELNPHHVSPGQVHSSHCECRPSSLLSVWTQAKLTPLSMNLGQSLLLSLWTQAKLTPFSVNAGQAHSSQYEPRPSTLLSVWTQAKYTPLSAESGEMVHLFPICPRASTPTGTGRCLSWVFGPMLHKAVLEGSGTHHWCGKVGEGSGWGVGRVRSLSWGGSHHGEQDL